MYQNGEITVLVTEAGWEAILNRTAETAEAGTTQEEAIETLLGKISAPSEHNCAA